MANLCEQVGEAAHYTMRPVLKHQKVAEDKTRSEISHTFQCMVLTKYIWHYDYIYPPLSWSQKNCVIHSFTNMCHNLLVKVAKVV